MLDPDLTLMLLCDFFHNSKAETGPADPYRGLFPFKGSEDAL